MSSRIPVRMACINNVTLRNTVIPIPEDFPMDYGAALPTETPEGNEARQDFWGHMILEIETGASEFQQRGGEWNILFINVLRG